MDIGFWIVIAYFVLSALGSILSRQGKAASRAKREAERQEKPTLESARDRDAVQEDRRLGAEPSEPEPIPVQERAATRQQSAEDIAAEIRRVMGLERREAEVEVIEEVYEPTTGTPDYVFDPDIRPGGEPDHGGDLHARIESRNVSGVASRHLTSSIGRETVGSLASRYQNDEGDLMPRTTRAAFRGSENVDLTNVARALVTAEILGPPKAYRGDEYGVY